VREPIEAEDEPAIFKGQFSSPSKIMVGGSLLTDLDMKSKIMSHADFISEFVARYRHEWDYYDQVARLCAEQCERGLDELGIQAMVTHRAKRPDRLEKKLRQRSLEEAYGSVAEISKGIRDLAGVRIALYFPGDRREVDRFIREHFEEAQPATYVEGSKSLDYITRSSGYSATHYRIRLKKDFLYPPQFHYCDSAVEIQVASVFMHAWAEVEHDLAYKPKMGDPSESELDILHELSCMSSDEMGILRYEIRGEFRPQEASELISVCLRTNLADAMGFHIERASERSFPRRTFYSFPAQVR
jgi:ppGpp synthetase/RelA/SpoT-type nucleotidyltranferase